MHFSGPSSSGIADEESGVILKIGSVSLQANRVKLGWHWTPVVSKRGYLMYRRLAASFTGTVSDPSSLSNLEDLIEDTETAAKTLDQDFKLFFDDGTTESKHVVETADTMDGTRISFGWGEGTSRATRGSGVEYLAYRSFRGLMTCEIADPEEEIVEMHETIRQIGSGGAEFVVKESIPSTPIIQVLQAATGLQIIQEGYAVGFTGYPAFPAPVIPLSLRAKPTIYERLPPTYGRYVDRLFTSRWRYVMDLTTAPGSPIYPTGP